MTLNDLISKEYNLASQVKVQTIVGNNTDFHLSFPHTHPLQFLALIYHSRVSRTQIDVKSESSFKFFMKMKKLNICKGNQPIHFQIINQNDIDASQ